MIDRVYSHILVPTDFHPDRRAAYRVALAAASGTGATGTLLHVAPMPTGEEEDEYLGLDAIRLMHRSAEGRSKLAETAESITAANAELENRLRAEVPSHQAGAVRVQCVARRGEVAAEVRRFVREAKVDLLVVTDSPPGLFPTFGRKLADRLAHDMPAEVVRVTPAEARREPATV